jgi:uncharacterized protein YajQ (UPF0234 family)
MQELKNALIKPWKLSLRFDFKNSKTDISLKKKKGKICLSDDE